jgi:GNAT superfamily N-acetyltransferase
MPSGGRSAIGEGVALGDSRLVVRPLEATDFETMIAVCRRVYPTAKPWLEAQLASHLRVFPEGQLVAEDRATGELLGFASSLIVRWDDYAFDAEWREWTAGGYFTNHDPEVGKTLYGAEVMVDPARQRQGIGRLLYRARADLACRLGLRRIRAAARLRGFGARAAELSPEAYVDRVVRGEIRDPTLSFQLSEGFRVLAVVSGYLRNDEESQGHAAIIEWLNPDANSPDSAGSNVGSGAGSGLARP